MEHTNDTSSSVPIVEPESCISVTINVKERAERKIIRELNQRIERLRYGSSYSKRSERLMEDLLLNDFLVWIDEEAVKEMLTAQGKQRGPDD